MGTRLPQSVDTGGAEFERRLSSKDLASAIKGAAGRQDTGRVEGHAEHRHHGESVCGNLEVKISQAMNEGEE
jgi:hypothetical protein